MMQLTVTRKPSINLLNEFHEISPIPGEWILARCELDVADICRAEYKEKDCDWSYCVFVNAADYNIWGCSVDDILHLLRNRFRVTIPNDMTVHVHMRDGVIGVCAR